MKNGIYSCVLEFGSDNLEHLMISEEQFLLLGNHFKALSCLSISRINNEQRTEHQFDGFLAIWTDLWWRSLSSNSLCCLWGVISCHLFDC